MMGRKSSTRNGDMAKGNPLQEQLLKAGLVKKSKLAEVAREQNKARHAKGPSEAGESEYRFTADGAIRTVLVNDELRQKLSSGALVIVRTGDRYELLPRAAAEKVRERDANMIVLDHGQEAGTKPPAATSEDDAYYAQFQVPDDLVW